MIGIGTMLAGVGINFVKDLITDNGEDLVKAGIKRVTGIDLGKNTKLTPEQVKAINDAEMQIRELDYKKLSLEYQNTNDARSLQKVALSQEDTFSKRFVYYFAAFWSVTAVVYIFMITFITIPKGNERFADVVLGFLLGTIIATIINYFYGSSRGSKEKTDRMHELSQGVRNV